MIKKKYALIKNGNNNIKKVRNKNNEEMLRDNKRNKGVNEKDQGE